MPAIIAAIIGGGAAIGGAASSQPKTQSTLSRGQGDISNRLAKFFQGMIFPTTDKYGHTKYQFRGATPYRGDFLAPLMGQYGQAFDMLNSYNPAAMSSKQQNEWGNLMGGRSASGQAGYQAQLDPTTTAKYFESAVTNPMMHTFQSQILPQINEGFAGVGAFSSRQGDARQRALSDLQSNLTGQLGTFQLANQQEQQRLNSQLYEASQQRALQALQGYGQQQLSFANQPLLAAGAMGNFLQPLQQRQDQGVLAGYQDFLRMTPENNPYMASMLQYISQQQKALVQQPNYLSQGIGGVAGGLGIWQALSQNQQNVGSGGIPIDRSGQQLGSWIK